VCHETPGGQSATTIITLATKLVGYPAFIAETKTDMKSENVSRKPSNLWRILPLLALVAGAVPVIAHASEFDCWDCLNTAQEMYSSYSSWCYSLPYEQQSGCLSDAQNQYNWFVGQCWSSGTCPGT
jgi:hypothetical protein